MTREEKMADSLWYYIERYRLAFEAGFKVDIVQASRSLDRELLRALRSMKR